METLARHRADADRELRAGALLVLAVLGDDGSADELCRCCIPGLDRDLDHVAHQQAGADGLRVLQRLASSESPWVRSAVVRRVADLGEPGYLPLLERLVGDQDLAVRHRVAWALEDLPPSDELVKHLLRGLDDPASVVRSTAAWASDRYEQDAVTNALLRLLRDPSPYVRRGVLQGLSGRAPDLVTSPLLEALNGGDWRMQRAAARALGRTAQDPSLTRRFIGQLHRDDPNDRWLAVSALPLRTRPDLCERAIDVLADEDVRVRRAAQAALWMVRHDAARRHLRTLLESSNPYERRYAVRTLAEERDNVDRRLLSLDLTGRYEWHDPRWPVTVAWVRIAAWRLMLSVDEIKRRYEVLANDFNLRLSWRCI